MADARIDIELLKGLALPYQAAAEAALTEVDLDPAFDQAWQALVTTFPDLTLEPLFSLIEPEVITNITDAIRMGGEEPPDPLCWFFVACQEQVVDVLLPLVQALPFVHWADVRPEFALPGVVSWGTNPQTLYAGQIAPSRVDSIYAWHVPGGTGEHIHIADVEHGWNLEHEDLLDAHITYLVPQTITTRSFIDHGTAMAGIAVARDNGRGIVGVAPRARLTAVPWTKMSLAEGIEAAGTAALPGGVILIEAASQFVNARAPDIPAEFSPPVQMAIRRATMFGITVVEPAGNGDVNLDQFPFLTHLRMFDSRAIVVGAGMRIPNPTRWMRAHYPDSWGSSFGGRVDCFAPATDVRAPWGPSNTDYVYTSGTSSASAIIAGLVACVQGMALAASNNVLQPTDIRRLLRDPRLGAPTVPPAAGIGAMPSLRKICRAQGWPAIMPASLVATTPDSMTVAYLDADLRLLRRQWAPATGWGHRLPLTSNTDEQFEIIGPQQVATTTGFGGAPSPKPITDVVAFSGGSEGGVHYLWWDSVGSSGSWATVRTPAYSFAGGRSLSAVRARSHTLAIIGVNQQGQLTSMLGDLRKRVSDGFAHGAVVDAATRYLRPSEPAACTRSPGHLDVIMISDIGSLVWYHATTTEDFATQWAPPAFEQTGTEFVPTARPGVVATPSGLEVVAVGADGWLYSISINTATGTISPPEVIDVQVTVSGDGPVAIVRHRQSLIALAAESLDDPNLGRLIDGPLRAATKPSGGEWSSLQPVDPNVAVSGLGGVSAVAMDRQGIAAVAMLPSGHPHYALSPDGVLWSPLWHIELELPIL